MNALRPLGCIEQSLELLNRRAATWNVLTVSRVRGPLTVDLLRCALDLACARHPRLSCRIIGEPGRLRFAADGQVLWRVSAMEHPEDWQAVAEAELNEPIASAAGLVRVHLVCGPAGIAYLMTTTHHAISDALSCVRLHREVLIYCGHLALGKSPPTLGALPPLPSIEALAPKHFAHPLRGWWFLLKTGFVSLCHRPAGLPVEKHVPVEDRRTGLRSRVLETDLTRTLVHCCRREQTSVQAALSAALLFAVAERIDPTHTRTVRLNFQSYLNLRRLLQPPVEDEHLGVLASTCRHDYILTPTTDFWALARQVKQDLEVALQHRDLFTIMAVSGPMFELLLRFPRQRAFSASVSNIGRVEIPESYGPLLLEQISYAGSNALMAGVLATNVTTFQDRMTMNFIYSLPSVSPRTVEAVVEAVVAQLSAAVQEPCANPGS